MTADWLTRTEAAETEHLALYATAGEVGRFGPRVAAVYAGPELPVNVAAGFGPQDAGHLPEVEAFYARHGLPSRVVLYSNADAGLLTALAGRGYILNRVLHAHARRLDAEIPNPVLPVHPAEPAVWADLAGRAFGPGSEAIMRLSAARPNTSLWVCEVDGDLVAAGALSLFGGLALLYSAATVPEWRGRGAQTALLLARLHFARQHGADLAAVLTSPGTISERNMHRAGFQTVGARLSFERG